MTEFLTALRGSSPLPLLVVSTMTTRTALDRTGIPYTLVNSLSGQTLSNYAGVFADLWSVDAAFTGFESAVSAYVAGAGSLAVEGYGQNNASVAALNSVLGFAPPVTAYSRTGTLPGIPVGYDNEIVTSSGAAFGLSPNGIVGSWGHIGYDADFFATKGYVSLVSIPDPETSVKVSGLLMLAPEPGSLALSALGIAVGTALLRRVSTSA